MRTLYAGGCTLEPQVVAHVEEMFTVLGDTAIYEFENDAPPSRAALEERFSRLESRASPDGTQAWLNWVVRLPTGELAGYVQATVLPTGEALIAYELASRFWRRGIGRSAVAAMLAELADHYGVHTYVAVLKAANFRSRGLLESLRFAPASSAEATTFGAAADEATMVRRAEVAAAGAVRPW